MGETRNVAVIMGPWGCIFFASGVNPSHMCCCDSRHWLACVYIAAHAAMAWRVLCGWHGKNHR